MVVSFAQSFIENHKKEEPSPAKLLDSLSGFLGEFAELFVVDLWVLLKQAEESENGVVG